MKRVVAILCFITIVLAYQQQYIGEGWYSSAKNLLSTDLSSVTMYYDCTYDLTFEQCTQQNWRPPLQYASVNDYWQLFLDPASCLGVAGPIGPFGVLSTLGPLGMNVSTPNITFVNGNLNGTCLWCLQLEDWLLNLQNLTFVNPLGVNGPLGQLGPLTTTQVYNTMYHINEAVYLANNFPTNLDITGVWGILGPLSVLGALGPLGPLGPLYQSSLYSTTNPVTHQNDGQYRDTSGKIVRTLTMQYSFQTYRMYELLEIYPVNTAIQLGSSKQQDTSFAVEGALTSSHKQESFSFCSNFHQVVSVLVIPVITQASSPNPYDAIFSDFDLTITSNSGKTLMKSNCQTSHELETNPKDFEGFIDWIIFRAAPGDCFQAVVTASYLNSANNNYRLFVVGDGFLSGPNGNLEDEDTFSHQNIFGSFQGNYQ